ncbi:MAG: hypothetical protein KDD60_09115 [Bdellovibrionales bacterium]|nr:hypothetical protein [Bdellovibrionales bacterium]
MALISTDNLTIPFKNRWHLVTICIFALLFGVWRASGGSVEVRSTGDRLLGDFNSPRSTSPSQSRSPSSAPTSRSNVDSLINGRGNSPQPARNSGNRGGSALDDIEKSLGLRR